MIQGVKKATMERLGRYSWHKELMVTLSMMVSRSRNAQVENPKFGLQLAYITSLLYYSMRK